MNAVADTADATPGDGLCSTGLSVNDPVLGLIPECTLRAAIGEANARPGRDQITFTSTLIYNAITGTATFTPASDYPDVTDPVDIDGTTAPGWVAGGIPRILISGQGFLNGLDLQAGSVDSTVQGLAFQGFASGISLVGTAGAWIDACSFGYFNVPVQPGSETVVGNVRGIDVDASGSPIPNGRHGIFVRSDTDRVVPVLVGATSVLSPEDFDLTGNHIAFNVQDGVAVLDEGRAYIRGNRITGNGDRPIDLGNDGVTPNDAGDVDLGPNWLQNHPELTPGISFLDVATGDVVVHYQVPSDPLEAWYPLTLDFYLADLDGEEPELLLGSEEIPDTEAGLLRTFAFTPSMPLVQATHTLVATATDAGSRTSEASPAITLPEPGPGPVLALGVLLLVGLAGRRARGAAGER